MKLSQLVLKSMKKNIRHYYLYFFALIFSVTLFFSFVTLQYNDTISLATEESGTATSGFKAASYLLYAIVLIFVLYANHLFMKRRSKEIGLYQLIGMTKSLVTRIIAFENILLFVGAVAIGLGLGLVSSRLFALILLALLKIDVVVGITFSSVAIYKTLIVFGVLLVIILIQMIFIVRKSSLLALFNASNIADERVKPLSIFQIIMGVFGIALIAYGYYMSTILLSGKTSNLLLAMVNILAATIIGTYIVFRYSVSFIMNLFRKRKNGHLSLSNVLALTPLMHRMKSNAKSLTLITVLTAFSLAVMTLSYISYYSVGSTAKQQVPADYISIDGNEQAFVKALNMKEIPFEEEHYQLTTATLNLREIYSKEEVNLFTGSSETNVLVVSLKDYQQIDSSAKLEEGQAIIAGYGGFSANILPLKAPLNMHISHGNTKYSLKVTEVNEKPFLSWSVTAGGFVFIVENKTFDEIQALNKKKQIGYTQTEQTSINLVDASEAQIAQAEKLYKKTKANSYTVGKDKKAAPKLNSLKATIHSSLNSLGVTIFTTAFLGLAFLVATGSILYFKQMSEADEEAASYTILRKIGFTQDELLRGIKVKQLFNFGVPLFIGLLHSYFAVKSGWFLFGTEMVTPMIITMGLYVILYFIFAALTVKYYKKIIKEAL